MMQRLKVLASVYACEPEKGSEPGVGWNWVKQIARFHEVWAITRANNRDPIERELAKQPMLNVRWVYFDLPRWTRFWKKGRRGVHLYYYLWQIGAYLKGKRLQRKIGFDIVHHIAFGNYWLPSFLSFLPVPFVWGPLGGGESAPRSFYKSFSWRGRIYERLRNITRWIGERDPFVRFDARRAKLALAKANETAERLRLLGATRVQLYSESGIGEGEVSRLNVLSCRDDDLFRVVSIGHLLHWKGFHLGLMAFADFLKRFPSAEYWIIGIGPERRNLECLAQRLGLATKVRFWGNLPRESVLHKLMECDVLVHPSLHDSGGWVCLEAMSSGLPVVCLDLGGPPLQVTDETGFKVRAVSPRQVVEDLADAMYRLAKDASLRARMGKAGRERLMECFDWNKKGEWIREVYEQLTTCNGTPHS
jgi:glycosyltransferase involved in cell wall biosynthesis